MKPFRGYIKDWQLLGIGEVQVIIGTVLGEASTGDQAIRTSQVVYYCAQTGVLEIKNSRYRLL